MALQESCVPKLIKAAVVAHFDPGNLWDENFLELLRVLSKELDKIVVVTTGSALPTLPTDLCSVKVIQRPNFGYDFYSYRTGLFFLSRAERLAGVFFVNSSIFLTNADKFRQLLRRMADASLCSAVRGVTESHQFGWHIQSYLIYFDLLRLDMQWLNRLFSKVEPVNSKIEIVLKYEIGMGRILQNEGVLTQSLFKPTLLQRFVGSVAYMASLFRVEGPSALRRRTFWTARRHINWTHFGAAAIAQQFGFAKAELLRGNPHRLSLDSVWLACDKKFRESIEAALERTSQQYAMSRSGLTELVESKSRGHVILHTLKGYRHRVTNARIAVVVHLFYVDLLDEIFDDLSNIPEPFDVYVTTPHEAAMSSVLDGADRRGFGVTVVLCANRGRDVGPFIAFFQTGTLDRYDAVLKIHSKKSRYSDKGDFWRRELFAPLCGDSLTVLRSLRLIREQRCGVVGPARYFLSNPNFWGANRERLRSILRSCRVEPDPSDPDLGFFAGTMFWFAPSALAAIHKARDSAVDFEYEDGRQDGTLAHAWERAFCLLARYSNYTVSATQLNGIDIFNLNVAENTVPVLNHP